MTDNFQFDIGTWKTHNDRRAVVLHRLVISANKHMLLGYIELDGGQQYVSIWTLGGRRPDGESSMWDLKRPAAKPREWWINIYDERGHSHLTREDADRYGAIVRDECVHVREVLREETDD